MIQEMPRGEYFIDDFHIKELVNKAYQLGYSQGGANVKALAACNFWLGLCCGVGLTIGGIMTWYWLKEEQKDIEELEDI